MGTQVIFTDVIITSHAYSLSIMCKFRLVADPDRILSKLKTRVLGKIPPVRSNTTEN